MPLLSIQVDGTTLVAIPTEGYSIVGARIGGTRDDSDHAGLNAWAGAYGKGPADAHNIWLDDFKLFPGQKVEVALAGTGTAVGVGRAMDRCTSQPPADYSIENQLQELAQEIRQLPWLRGPYRFRYESSQTAPMHCSLEATEYGFGFNVMWNDLHPERVSASLYAYTIDSVEKQEAGRTIRTERLLMGQRCILALVA
jgi:hypothetical protein